MGAFWGATSRAHTARFVVITAAGALCLPTVVSSPAGAAPPGAHARIGVTTENIATPGPVDRFKNRRPVGQEALVTSDSVGPTLGTYPQVQVHRISVTGNPPYYQDHATESSRDKSEESPFRSAVVEADLDMIRDSEGVMWSSREPGLAHAGLGLGCSAAGVFCVNWSRATYNSDHKFTGFGRTFNVDIPGVPANGSHVAMVAGRFAGQEVSLIVSFVDGATRTLKVAHIVAQREPHGGVTELVIAGPLLDLGAVLVDAADEPLASADLAAADFLGTGADQAAIVWAPGSSTEGNRSYGAALLEVDPQGALVEAVYRQSIPVAVASIPDAGKTQLTPGVTALRDTSGDKPAFHLVVGPGIYGNGRLHTLTQAKTGEFTVKAFGPGDANGNPDGQQSWVSFHARIAAVGDINGDGVEELASMPPIQLLKYGDSRLQIINMRAFAGSTYLMHGETDVISDGQMTVLDARTTKDQAIAPVPAHPMNRDLPQIAVVAPGHDVFPFCERVELQVVSLTTSGTPWADSEQALTECGQPDVPSVTSYAIDGYAELGNPVPGQYRTLEPSVILNAPPTHFDVLGQRMFDPNFCYAGNQYLVPEVCFFTSEYQRETSTSLEVSSESSEDWGISSELSTSFSLFSVVDIEASVTAGYGENFKNVDSTKTTDTVEVTVKARNTDKVYAIRRVYDTLEYPLFQPGMADPNAFLLTTTPHTVSKRWIDINSPDAVNMDVNHEPGNILSYPEDITLAENPFISPTENSSGKQIEAFAPQEFELSDFSDFTYTLTQAKVTEAEASTEKHWNIGSTLKGGGKVAGLVDVSLEVSGEYKNSNLSTTKTSVGSSTKLSASLGGIDESFGETAYTVKPFAYWTESATLVLDYAVSPGTAAPGEPKTWWQQMYGRNPDVTLKLPRLLDYEKQAGISSDAARFISPGVRIFKGPCTATDPLIPPVGYFKPGAPLCLRAQVENYSLKDAAVGSTVAFYDADPDVGGQYLGEASVPAIPARDSQYAYLSWTPDERYAGNVQRIFAVVDSGNVMTEIHEDNNKGFRSYRAVADPSIAVRAPQAVEAEISSGRTMQVTWEDSLVDVQPAGHEWRVVAYPEAGGAPLDVVVAGDQLHATFTDVPPGRYRVAVFAFTHAQTSPASHPSEPVDVASESPGSPSEVTGMAGDGAVVLQWKAPTATGGVPVDSYRIREFREPGQDFPETAIDTTVTGNTTGMTLSGLSNGRPYRFTVQAINVAGPGEQSFPSAAVTPLGVPERATDVKAQRGGPGTAKVSWEAPPLSSSRSPVTSYQVQVTPGGGITEVPGNATTAEIEDLARGVAYTFTVRPLSATGRGMQSEQSNPLTLPDSPTVPRSVVAKPGTDPGTVVVSWIQPLSTGGVALDSYEICRVAGECRAEPATALKTTFAGLPAAVPMQFTVKARNEAGLESPVESSGPVTLAVAPQVQMTSAPAEGSFSTPDVTIAFTTSIDGADLTCYIDGVGQACSSPVRLSGLVDGRHTFRVKALADGGTATTPLLTWIVDGQVPKADIDDLPLIARKGIPRLRYSASDRGGSGLAGYQIRTRENEIIGSFSQPVTVADPSTAEQRARRLNVRRGTTVCASVRAKDQVGNTSQWSAWKCASRPLDELALTAAGWWTPVKGRFFSEGHALQTYAAGSALSVRIGRTEAVTVAAVSCRDCGRLEVRHRGQVLRVIDLSANSSGDSRSAAGRHVREYSVPWPESSRGYLRLIAVGSGLVTVDSVMVQRQK